MSSNTVTRMKAKAAWRGRDDAVSAMRLSLLASCIRICLLAQGQPDRRAGQVEFIAQPIDQVALIGLRHSVSTGAENDKTRRPRFWLRDVVELEPPPGDRRRRMRFEHVIEPAIERVRRNALVPHDMDIDDRLHQPIDPLTGAARE